MDLKTNSIKFESFIKEDLSNPCLQPCKDNTFYCPVSNHTVYWEEKDVFNPAAVVRNGMVYLLYRAEDTIGRYAGTSRIGLAFSKDGRTFEKYPEPVLYPEMDEYMKFEWEGGCEDPRIVEDDKGVYYLTYTAYDGDTARLCVATSTDLYRWKKHGPAFEKAYEGKYTDFWSKSGSIVCSVEGEKLLAVRLNGFY